MSALNERILAKDLEGAWQHVAALGAAGAPEVLPLLGHGDPEVRALAAECLGAMRAPIAARGLIRALADPDLSVAGAAVTGLKALTIAPDLAPDLVAAFDVTVDWMIRRQIALLLGTVEGWSPALLRDRVGREPHAAVR